MGIENQYKQADWKTEKHVPVIECPDTAASGKLFEVKVSVGKEIPHPNTTEHHIRWIHLYFKPDNGNIYEVGTAGFTAHGESVDGPNKGSAYTEPAALFSLKISRPGTLIATSYCNIHGLWESTKAVAVQ